MTESTAEWKRLGCWARADTADKIEVELVGLWCGVTFFEKHWRLRVLKVDDLGLENNDTATHCAHITND